MTPDRMELLGAARAEREGLGRMIQYVPPGSWESPSPCEGWRNRDVMAHLAAQEYAAAQVVAGEEPTEFEQFREAQEDHGFWVDGFNEWAVVKRKDLPFREVIAHWGRAADLLLVRVSRLSDEEWNAKRVPWVAGEIGVRYLVQSRVVEWWLHGEDMRAGAGMEPRLWHWPIYLTNDLAIRMLPWALGRAELSFPGKSVRIDLEGAGGGTWHYGLGRGETPAEDEKPDAFITGRAHAFALVAGRRAAAEGFLDDGNLVLGGDEDLGTAVLEHIRAYAS
ncbi:MAG: maleylpyruvate isomerase family mycothiol-dependent enzyme [Actinobacteria bacterium]|nr:maleylpyruvate isomerase family mycothiol-dependent enzyme [Actinomycetota bacterium]